MRWKNTAENWGAVAKILHWGVAVTILAMIPFGWWMEGLEPLSRRIEMTQWHKAVGVLLLVFILLRVIWRSTSKTPALPADMPAWEKAAAHAGHAALYLAILAQPVIGVLMSQASPYRETYPVKLLGLPLPNVVPVNETLEEVMSSLHSAGAWAILLLVGLHVAAALKHHFIDKNRILVRMLPGRR